MTDRSGRVNFVRMERLLANMNLALQPLLADYEFTIKTGLARGLRRRFGRGFKPKFGMSREEHFLDQLNLTGRSVYDIGGYIGLFTLFFARKVGPLGRVITCEPNPENFNDLVRNVTLNHFENVILREVAVSNRNGKVELYLDPIYPSRGSIKEGARHEQRAARPPIEVEGVTLDTLIHREQLPKPDFVKIDVEGVELQVLHGMANVLESSRPELFIEIHGPLPEALVHFLGQFSYRLFHVERGLEIGPGSVGEVQGGHLSCVAPRA